MTSAHHDAAQIIRAKRDGYELSGDQIRWIMNNYVHGTVVDEQMSALAMAIVFRGMSREELSAWTTAMIDSGERFSFSGLPMRTVDKHSTGGVGDKITLPLAPLVAAHSVAVPQMAGRGLGHTGGTIDKLASIDGWRGDLDKAVIDRQLQDVGAVVYSAANDLAPGTTPARSARIVWVSAARGTGPLRDLLAHDRRRDEWDRFNRPRDVTERVQLPIRCWSPRQHLSCGTRPWHPSAPEPSDSSLA